MLTDYELNNYEGAGFIFTTFDMKFLLVKEIKSGKWGFCKGHREKKDNNDPLKTAKREAYEELGLTEDEYELDGSPFVLPSSPKIYVFQYARLKIDIMRKFAEKNRLSLTKFTPRKQMEITDINLVPFHNLIQDLNNYQNNVYLRLLQACLSGTFIPSSDRASIYSDSSRKASMRSTFSDAKSCGSDESFMRTPPQKKFYNSMVPGSSPIYIAGKLPDMSPIIASELGEMDLPPLQLESKEEMYPTGRSSPMRPRERTESGGSLLEALRGSPILDRGTSPFCGYPPISPSMHLYAGGGTGSGSISPRTCASNFILPHSPSPSLGGPTI